MSEFNTDRYKELRDNHTKYFKQIEPYESRRKLTKNTELLESYKSNIVNAHNEVIGYLADHFDRSDLNTQNIFDERAEAFVAKTKRAFSILNLIYNWIDNNYQQININEIQSEELELDNSESEESDTDVVKDNQDLIRQQTVVSGSSSRSIFTPTVSGNQVSNQQQIVETGHSARSILTPRQANVTRNMAQSASEFLGLASRILNSKFAGDPLKLESFINEVELVKSICERPNVAISVRFIKSRLEGKALECLPETVDDVDTIIRALKANIKTESSKVVEGKMLALRLIKGNFSDFAKKAEELAENFRRSLVVEGISKAKAEEMAIDKTVDLCRQTSHSDVVKAVLSAGAYDSPSGVIAKFITQSDLARKEKRETENFKNSKFNKNKGNSFNKNKNQQNFKKNNGQNQNQNQNNNNNNGRNGNQRRNNNNGRPEHQVRVMQGNDQPPQAERQDQQIPLN